MPHLFLSHKGDVWNWQNAEVLREDMGIEVRFYVAHRDGRLVSVIPGTVLTSRK